MPEKEFIAPGSMVSSYRVAELIGRGGFSQVWSAWDTRLNRLVAIKIMPRTEGDSHLTIQFGREASVITRLEHPHILPLYDFGETPGFRYLVMRYVTGGSLADRMEKERLPIQEILRLMTALAGTLDYIHAQRIVHRDLKPGNILLDAQGLPYLTDFGLAKELSDETRALHSASGTLTYMAPEQFSGGVMSTRSDQYSFGMLLYQLFAGDLPYGGQYAVGMRQLSNPDEKLPDITVVNPGLPAGLNAYLWALTDRKEEARPESVVEVMQSISNLFQGIESETISASPGISVALESGAYRRREAESLLQKHLEPWRVGQYTLSLTHFVLLDILLRDVPALVTPEVRSLMLRGALENNEQVDYWWKESADPDRQQACWHAIRNGSDAVCLHALSLAVTTAWIKPDSLDTVNDIGKRLMPLSDFTPTALTFLEKALPASQKWNGANDRLLDVDNNLNALATSHSPLARRAAVLIGSARRTRAARSLPTSLKAVDPILAVYETAGDLPDSFPLRVRTQLLIILAVRQLTYQPLQALGLLAWAAVANMAAFGLFIFIRLRGTDWLGSYRILNSIGQGLLFGLILGVGVWLTRHIMLRLRVAPYLVRVVLATLAGGLIVALGFTMYHKLSLDSIIDPATSIPSGILYVLGFALSVNMPLWAQFVAGLSGIGAALLIPWINYINYFDCDDCSITAPIIFDDLDPAATAPLAVGLTLLYGIVIAAIALGYLWWGHVRRFFNRRSPAGIAASDLH